MKGYFFISNIFSISRTKTGTVKWFNKHKGYGFIQQTAGPDVFAHASAIKSDNVKKLTEGQRVAFSITQGKRGPQAKNIVVI